VDKPVVASSEAAARSDPAGRALFAAGFSALLYGAPLLLPPLFPLLAIAPFPLIVQRLRGTVITAVGATLGAAALIALVFPPAWFALGYLLFFALPGLVLGEAMARGRGLRRATGWAVLVIGMQVCLILLFAHEHVATLFLSGFDVIKSAAFLDGMRSAGLPPDKLDVWVEQVTQARDVMAILYPSVALIMGATMVLANAWLLRTYLVRRDPGWLEGGEFEGLRWPLGVAVAFVAAGAAVLSPGLRPAAYNVLLVLAFLFALQGLAVVVYYVHRLAAPPFLRLVVLALVILNPWASQILALAGLFDIFIDFRKWAEPPVEES
jgi:uncharacterized protein YybS (DUF2232 family)